MTPEQKDRVRKLVRVLRTTKRKQGTGNLAKILTPRQKSYCCLGIACEMAIKEGLEVDREVERYAHANVVRYGGTTTTLPKLVMDWFGFEDFDPTLIDESEIRTTATDLNDERNYNFKRIAAAFERTYLSE